MSVYSTIFWADAYEEGPRRDQELRAGEPFTVDVATDMLTGDEPGERRWLRVSVSDALLPEGCTAILSPAQGLELLGALQRWRDSA